MTASTEMTPTAQRSIGQRIGSGELINGRKVLSMRDTNSPRCAVYNEFGRIMAIVVTNPDSTHTVLRPSSMGTFKSFEDAVYAATDVMPGEYIQNVHNEANDNAKNQGEIVKAAGAALGKCAVQDYKHWNGPRMASPTASIREATDGIKRVASWIAESADKEFTDWLYSEEGPYGRGEVK